MTVDPVHRDDPGDHIRLDRSERASLDADSDDGMAIGPTTQRAVHVGESGRRAEHRDAEPTAAGDGRHRPYDLGESDGRRRLRDGSEVDGGEVTGWHIAHASTEV